MQSQNNPLTEIGVVVIALALIAAATTLLILGKVDFTGASLMFGLAVGLLGVQGAYRAPSPTQQAALQQLLQQVLALLTPKQ